MKAVLFDMDGTLIDSEVFYYGAWVSVLDHYGISMDQSEWLATMSGRTVPQVYAYFKEHFSLSAEESDFYQRISLSVAAQYKHGRAGLMPGVKEILAFLHEQDIRMAVVTSSHLEITESNLHHLAIRHYFETLVTREDVTHPKPAAEPYLVALERMGLAKEDCLVLEDSLPGTMSAQAAGIPCFAVQSQQKMRTSLPATNHFSNLGEVLEELKVLV